MKLRRSCICKLRPVFLDRRLAGRGVRVRHAFALALNRFMHGFKAFAAIHLAPMMGVDGQRMRSASLNRLAHTVLVNPSANANDHDSHLHIVENECQERFAQVGTSALPAEHVLNADTEKPGNSEGALERGRVLALLNRDHRLPGDADRLAKRGLAHTPMRFTQLTDSIGDRWALGHYTTQLWR